MGICHETNGTRPARRVFAYWPAFCNRKNAPAGASFPITFLLYNIQSLITLWSLNSFPTTVLSIFLSRGFLSSSSGRGSFHFQRRFSVPSALQYCLTDLSHRIRFPRPQEHHGLHRKVRIQLPLQYVQNTP